MQLHKRNKNKRCEIDLVDIVPVLFSSILEVSFILYYFIVCSKRRKRHCFLFLHIVKYKAHMGFSKLANIITSQRFLVTLFPWHWRQNEVISLRICFVPHFDYIFLFSGHLFYTWIAYTTVTFSIPLLSFVFSLHSGRV